jgi:hypothetical protein
MRPLVLVVALLLLAAPLALGGTCAVCAHAYQQGRAGLSPGGLER